MTCLSTAEISRIKDMSKQLQYQSPTTTTTTTTKNNMFGRVGVQGNGSNQPVGNGVGVGECMSYYNVGSFEKICKSKSTTKITTTNDNDNDDTKHDRQHDEPRSRRPCGPPKDPSCGLPKQSRRRTPKRGVGASAGTDFPAWSRVGELRCTAWVGDHRV